MKTNVTKFDFDAAFKALDEIEIPKVSGLKPRRDNLKESVKRVDRLSMLIEDYYDINDNEDLGAAKEDRDADIAKAKLDRIERIVDLDAETADDILPSYVGKNIIQCPNCLNLFYKDPEDVETSEETPNLVNVGEACQHCGNDTGYTLIGKVAEDKAPVEEAPAEEIPVEENPELDLENNEEQPNESEVAEENNEEELPEAPEMAASESAEAEEEKKEESFSTTSGSPLNEEIDSELNKKLDEHNEYITYLQNEINKAEDELKNAKNNFVKDAIQRKLNSLKLDLENAIPDEVKASTEPEIPEEEVPEIPAEETNAEDKEPKEEIKESLLNAPVNLTIDAHDFGGQGNDVSVLSGPGLPGLGEDIEDKKDCEDCEEGLITPLGAGLLGAGAGILGGLGISKLTEEESSEEGPQSDEVKAEMNSFMNSLNSKSDKEAKETNDDEKNLSDSIFDTFKDFDKDNVIDEAKEVSNAEFKAMLDNPLYNENLEEDATASQISAATDKAVKEIENIDDKYLADVKKELADQKDNEESKENLPETEIEENDEDFDEITDESLNTHISNLLTEVYSNVDSFTATNCEMPENKLIVEGVIKFKSGNTKNTTFEFEKDKNSFNGINESIAKNAKFNMSYSINNKILTVESISYKLNIDNNLVEGITKK